MSAKFFAFAIAVGLAACSNQQQPPPPAQSGSPSTPAQTAAPAQPAGQPSAQPAPSADATKQPASPQPQPAATDALKQPASPQPDAPAQPAPPSGAAQLAPAQPAPEPAPQPEEPKFREVTIPAGTALSARLTTPIASDKSQLEDEVRATLAAPIRVDGVVVVPAGSEVVGTVRSAKRSGRVKGRASVAFRFERIVVRSEPLTIRTALISREAETKKSEDVKKGAIGAAAGAVIGGIAGGGKGAAIGAGVGGTGAVVATRGEEVRLAAGTTVRTTLQEPLRVVVPLQ
ncbi:MAG TPA: hypothetical protein VFK20_03660 [Vicinamibacterales bacterium]|nr:hypothetical protein [Vicinamibacterales bacterium]